MCMGLRSMLKGYRHLSLGSLSHVTSEIHTHAGQVFYVEPVPRDFSVPHLQSCMGHRSAGSWGPACLLSQA